MDFKTELKLTFKKCRWAAEELVYDAKMIEWNRLYSAGYKAMLEYLADRIGSKDEALRALAEQILKQKKNELPPDRSKWWKAMVRHFPWAIDEYVVWYKEQDAYYLMQSNNDMYAYLKETYGSGREVLKSIRQLVYVQDGPRKSLLFRQHWFKPILVKKLAKRHGK